MGFGQAVSTCFSKYATFSGRARRSEYWWFVLFQVVVLGIAAGLDNAFHTTFGSGMPYGWIYAVAVLALVVPSIAVTVRRLHDTGRSGWWWFLSLLCGIGAIILFIFCLIDGTPGPNQYGPSPKY
jgi:uncharacterized membrane protein YhaH (DUF805 family)